MPCPCQRDKGDRGDPANRALVLPLALAVVYLFNESEGRGGGWFLGSLCPDLQLFCRPFTGLAAVNPQIRLMFSCLVSSELHSVHNYNILVLYI